MSEDTIREHLPARGSPNAQDRDRQPEAGPSRLPEPVRTSSPGLFTRSRKTKPSPPATSDPFPQIRGTKLEQLFFSLPEHNEATCRTCRTRNHPRSSSPPGSLRLKKAASTGPRVFKDADAPIKAMDAAASALGRARRRKELGIPLDDEDLPPQTIMARLLRDLEDDCVHFKS
jgi:hypothetical protein